MRAEYSLFVASNFPSSRDPFFPGHAPAAPFSSMLVPWAGRSGALLTLGELVMNLGTSVARVHAIPGGYAAIKRGSGRARAPS